MKLSKKQKTSLLINNENNKSTRTRWSDLVKCDDDDHQTSIPGYKLPILTEIELLVSNNVSNKSSESTTATTNDETSSLLLYNDYLLISSKLKFKYLLHSLFQLAEFDNKASYKVMSGYLKMRNWDPISLDALCKVEQCDIVRMINEEAMSSSSEQTGAHRRHVLHLPADSTDSENEIEELLASSDDDNNEHSNEQDQITMSHEEEATDSTETKRLNGSTNHNGDVNNNSVLSSKRTAVDKSIKSLPFHSCDDDNDSVTVYDVLSHVLSFSSLNIKVTLKSDSAISSGENSSQPVDSSLTATCSLTEPLKLVRSLPKLCATQQKHTLTSESQPNLSSLAQQLAQLNSPNNNGSPPMTAGYIQLFNNLPIIAQLLNNIKNNTSTQVSPSQTAQQLAQNQSSLLKKLALNSSLNNSKLSVNTTSSTDATMNSKSSCSPSSSSSSSTTSSKSIGNNKSTILNQSKSIFSSLSTSNHNSNSNKLAAGKKQRERTTFDPQEEITRLMQIFQRTHHPTRYQIVSICEFLNSLTCRKDKKPLEPYNIQYWFKNARAALRKKIKADPSLTGSLISGSGSSTSGSALNDEIIASLLTGGAVSRSNGHAGVNNSSANSNGSMMAMMMMTDDDFKNRFLNEFGEGGDDDELSEDDEDDLDLDDLDKINRNLLCLDNDEDDVEACDMNNNNINNNMSNELSDEDDLNNESRKKIDHQEEFYLDEDDEIGNDAMNNSQDQDRDFDNQEENYSLYDDLDDEDEDCALEKPPAPNANLIYFSQQQQKNFLVNSSKPAGVSTSTTTTTTTTKTSTNSGNGASSRRNRVFIDPITEVPVLEHYFSIETYPDHFLIEKICNTLNSGEYRYKFPKLEPRNIQLWFKNHRAKLKRLKTTTTSSTTTSAGVGVGSID